jgi:hypothetical protein
MREATMTDTQTTEPIAQFLQSIEEGAMGSCDALSPEVELDATVPNWRFSVHGDEAVRAELSRWYAEPGAFEELRRIPIPGGEMVQFTLTWTEAGVPHAVHQSHTLEVADGRITRDQVWCGGRWPASLLAEMAQAQTEAASA